LGDEMTSSGPRKLAAVLSGFGAALVVVGGDYGGKKRLGRGQQHAGLLQPADVWGVRVR